MDREDLDQQLKEHGEAMQKEITGSRKGRMKLFAAALALLVIGGAGGCFFGEFPAIPKKDGASSSYQVPQGADKKLQELPAIRNTAIVQAVKEVGRSSASRPRYMTAICLTAASKLGKA